VQIEGQLNLFDTGDDVLPGITAVALAPWHTPGMTIFRIAGGSNSGVAGAALYFTGDAFHHEVTAVENPHLQFAYDTDHAAGALGRQALLGKLAAERALVIGSHVTPPPLGVVTHDGIRFSLRKVSLLE
jgi:glyoxylase-like metal-dependent hydrolase (beta-lactamase superfamily II)